MHLVVDADKRGNLLNIKELLHYKDLFYILAYLRVRYAQTFLGLLSTFRQPLAMLTIITLMFGRVLKVDAGYVPYPLFAVVGFVDFCIVLLFMIGLLRYFSYSPSLNRVYSPIFILPTIVSTLTIDNYLSFQARYTTA